MADPQPSSNLYVTGLPLGVDDAFVKQLFSQYGLVQSVKVLEAKGTQQEAHALVKFSTVQEASWLCENLDGNIPDGLEHPVGVRFANAGNAGGGRASPYGANPAAAMMAAAFGKGGWGAPQQQWAAPQGGGAAGADSIESVIQQLVMQQLLPQPEVQYALYIANLPPDTSDNDLLKMFSPFGAIPPKGIKAMLHPDGQCKGIAFVNFADEIGAQAAVQALNGAMLPSGNTLIVKIKTGPGTDASGAMPANKGGGKGGFKGHPPIAESLGRHVGTITCFYPEKRFGFIDCPELKEQCGVDTFLSVFQLGDFQVGSVVSFEVAFNAKGNPQANNLAAADGMPTNAGAQSRYYGTITALYPDKHFGFVQCPELMEMYGKDTWVAEAEIGHLQVGPGSYISFDMTLNKQGCPQARNVSIASPT